MYARSTFLCPFPPLLSLNFFFFLFASNMKSIDHNEYVFYCGQYVREKKARACPPAASTTYIIITLLGAKKKKRIGIRQTFFFLAAAVAANVTSSCIWHMYVIIRASVYATRSALNKHTHSLKQIMCSRN